MLSDSIVISLRLSIVVAIDHARRDKIAACEWLAGKCSGCGISFLYRKTIDNARSDAQRSGTPGRLDINRLRSVIPKES